MNALDGTVGGWVWSAVNEDGQPDDIDVITLTATQPMSYDPTMAFVFRFGRDSSNLQLLQRVRDDLHHQHFRYSHSLMLPRTPLPPVTLSAMAVHASMPGAQTWPAAPGCSLIPRTRPRLRGARRKNTRPLNKARSTPISP